MCTAVVQLPAYQIFKNYDMVNIGKTYRYKHEQDQVQQCFCHYLILLNALPNVEQIAIYRPESLYPCQYGPTTRVFISDTQ